MGSSLYPPPPDPPKDPYRWILPGDLGVHRMDDLSKSRRRKRIILPENALINCVMLSAAVPGDYVVKLSLDLPPGTVVLARTYNVCEQGEELLVANEAWPELQAGSYPEIIKVKQECVLVCLQQTRHPENVSQPLIGKDGVTPLNLPFVIPMAEMEKISRIVANSILQGHVRVAPQERERAINFFNAILGSQAVTEAANFMTPEPETILAGVPDAKLVQAVGKATGILNKVTLPDGSVGYRVPHDPANPQASVEAHMKEREIEQEFTNTALGGPHKVDDPFNKTWRDKKPLL